MLEKISNANFVRVICRVHANHVGSTQPLRYLMLPPSHSLCPGLASIEVSSPCRYSTSADSDQSIPQSRALMLHVTDLLALAEQPLDAEGRTYHVSTAPGQTANRILTVGDPARLHRVSKHLDEWPEPFERVSQRGYTTVTGRYKGVPVTLIAIGMGVAMTDFFVREVRAVVQGEIAIVRFGSCGSLDPSLKVGSLGVPERAVTISTNYNYFHPTTDTSNRGEPYFISNPINADQGLQRHLFETLTTAEGVVDEQTRVKSLNLHASADCFYSSQGRIDSNFQDDNDNLISTLLERNPECSSLEMETAHLLHLASIASPNVPIRAAAVHMVFAGRSLEKGGQGDFIDPQTVAQLEPKVGKACLDALVSWEIPKEKLHPEQGSVWDLSKQNPTLHKTPRLV
ncbi:nucleoside phosphorylase [Sporobolomyces koalae]|uniref:nucleoside phosphorylase n=1 Tax=Sporobolomyces koalae TaxID=500713 RepID=UPI00316B4765